MGNDVLAEKQPRIDYRAPACPSSPPAWEHGLSPPPARSQTQIR
jgi:hypothetical protein